MFERTSLGHDFRLEGAVIGLDGMAAALVRPFNFGAGGNGKFRRVETKILNNDSRV